MRGDLGAGKTTFAGGVLKALGAEGPYTSPTFAIVRTYALSENTAGHSSDIHTIYHIDAYRIGEDDIINIGWEEMIHDSQALILIEWPDRIGTHLPNSAYAISFEWTGDDGRTITCEKCKEH